MVVPVIVTKIRFRNVSVKTDPVILREVLTLPQSLPATLNDDGSTEQQQQMTDNASTQVAETGQRAHYPQCVRRSPDQ